MRDYRDERMSAFETAIFHWNVLLWAEAEWPGLVESCR